MNFSDVLSQQINQSLAQTALDEWRPFKSAIDVILGVLILLAVVPALWYATSIIRHGTPCRAFNWVTSLGSVLLWSQVALYIVDSYQNENLFELSVPPPSTVSALNDALKRQFLFQVGRICLLSAAFGVFSVALIMFNTYSPGVKNDDEEKIFRRKLFDEGKFSDFVIRTGDAREIRAHRVILEQTSLYFEAMFELNGVEVQRGEISVPEPFPVMNELIRFLYTGNLSKNWEKHEVIKLSEAADKYLIDGLEVFLNKN